MANRLKEKYTNEVVPVLTEKFNYSSVMAVPKVEKIVLNMGVGDAVNNAKNLEKAAAEQQRIAHNFLFFILNTLSLSLNCNFEEICS